MRGQVGEGAHIRVEGKDGEVFVEDWEHGVRGQYWTQRIARVGSGRAEYQCRSIGRKSLRPQPGSSKASVSTRHSIAKTEKSWGDRSDEL
eukprot:1068944-Rhodomonas_salina.1